MAMTRKQIKTITCALFHDGIEVGKLPEKAKNELREAVDLLLAELSRSLEIDDDAYQSTPV